MKTGTLVGRRAEDSSGRRLGHIVGVVHRADGTAWALVQHRVWFQRRCVMVPLDHARVFGEILVVEPRILQLAGRLSRRGRFDAA